MRESVILCVLGQNPKSRKSVCQTTPSVCINANILHCHWPVQLSSHTILPKCHMRNKYSCVLQKTVHMLLVISHVRGHSSVKESVWWNIMMLRTRMIYDLNGLTYQYFTPLIETSNNACGQGEKTYTHTHKHTKPQKHKIWLSTCGPRGLNHLH